MKKFKIKIDKIDLTDKQFIIYSTQGEIFISKIIKGSINFEIYNEHNLQVTLKNIEVGDRVKIYGNKINRNNIIINKIIIKNKYIFNLDSETNSPDNLIDY